MGSLQVDRATALKVKSGAAYTALKDGCVVEVGAAGCSCGCCELCMGEGKSWGEGGGSLQCSRTAPACVVGWVLHGCGCCQLCVGEGTS